MFSRGIAPNPPVHAGSGRKARRRSAASSTDQMMWLPLCQDGSPDLGGGCQRARFEDLPARQGLAQVPVDIPVEALQQLQQLEAALGEKAQLMWIPFCKDGSADLDGTCQQMTLEDLQRHQQAGVGPGQCVLCGGVNCCSPDSCVNNKCMTPTRSAPVSQQPREPKCPGQIVCADGRCVDSVLECDLPPGGRTPGYRNNPPRAARPVPQTLEYCSHEKLHVGGIEGVYKVCCNKDTYGTTQHQSCSFDWVAAGGASPGSSAEPPTAWQQPNRARHIERGRARNPVSAPYAGLPPSPPVGPLDMVPGNVSPFNYPHVWPRGITLEEAQKCQAWHWAGWHPVCTSYEPGIYTQGSLQRDVQPVPNPAPLNRPPLPSRKARRQPRGISLR